MSRTRQTGWAPSMSANFDPDRSAFSRARTRRRRPVESRNVSFRRSSTRFENPRPRSLSISSHSTSAVDRSSSPTGVTRTRSRWRFTSTWNWARRLGDRVVVDRCPLAGRPARDDVCDNRAALERRRRPPVEVQGQTVEMNGRCDSADAAAGGALAVLLGGLRGARKSLGLVPRDERLLFRLERLGLLVERVEPSLVSRARQRPPPGLPRALGGLPPPSAPAPPRPLATHDGRPPEPFADEPPAAPVRRRTAACSVLARRSSACADTSSACPCSLSALTRSSVAAWRRAASS